MTTKPGFLCATPLFRGSDSHPELQRLCRIEKSGATGKDLDLLLEIAGSMGIMPGTTICGLADGNNWAMRRIINKYREEFEARVRLVSVAAGVSVGAG